MRYLMIPLFTLLASPAMAATGPFFSLRNTNFIVLLAFILASITAHAPKNIRHRLLY